MAATFLTHLDEYALRPSSDSQEGAKRRSVLIKLVATGWGRCSARSKPQIAVISRLAFIVVDDAPEHVMALDRPSAPTMRQRNLTLLAQLSWPKRLSVSPLAARRQV